MRADTDREQETIEGLAFGSPEVDWLSPLRSACEAALSDVDQPALGRQRDGLRAANGVELF
jgi:hypothetical protein